MPPEDMNITSPKQRRVRLLRHGRSQVLRIPREFELGGEEATLRREGDRLIVEPVRKGQLLTLLASLEPLDVPFPNVDEDLSGLDKRAD
jgi:antitoxin VapB